MMVCWVNNARRSLITQRPDCLRSTTLKINDLESEQERGEDSKHEEEDSKQGDGQVTAPQSTNKTESSLCWGFMRGGPLTLGAHHGQYLMSNVLVSLK